MLIHLQDCKLEEEFFSHPSQMQTLAKISVELCTKILNFAQRQLESTTAP